MPENPKIENYLPKNQRNNLYIATKFYNKTMDLKQTISIEDFERKHFQIKLVEGIEDKAVLTHYLHNYKNGEKKHYQKDALKTLRQFIEYKQQEEELLIVAEDALQQLLFEVENVPFPTPENYTFKFIDLFAGIGGFRLALQNVGGKCVFTSEWNIDAKKTYKENFGEIPFGDITKERNKKTIFLINLMFCVLDFLVKHFQLQVTKKVLRIQEELCFLILNKL